jgi:hypothetical protein
MRLCLPCDDSVVTTEEEKEEEEGMEEEEEEEEEEDEELTEGGRCMILTSSLSLEARTEWEDWLGGGREKTGDDGG